MAEVVGDGGLDTRQWSMMDEGTPGVARCSREITGGHSHR